ncbi:hypothetical protein [Streptomyces monomycini]|uniref:hypothetical protein n=1 Tax=Streptomyces monomycini TaxID=371720 RepID=UPI001EECAC71|nr:hypothetical protein [Streptomyces monomycini]
MTNISDITAGTAHHGEPGVQRAFATVRTCVKLYGALCALALVTVAAVAVSGHTVTTFMWVRAAVLLVIAPVVHRLAVRAGQGSRRHFERVCTLTAVMPIAIIAVDAVPGVCPPWYAVLQGVCSVPLIGAAFLTRGAALRTAFPKQRPEGRS